MHEKNLLGQLKAVMFNALMNQEFEDGPPDDYVYDKLIEFLVGLKNCTS